MTEERFIVIAVAVFSVATLFYIAKDKFRLAFVESALIDYPVRELWKANATSFSYEFFTLPILTTYYILHYPFDKPLKLRLLYTFAICSVFSFIEYWLEKYTLVVQYHAWRWYWTWISMAVLFYVVMLIYRWFFKIKRVFSL